MKHDESLLAIAYKFGTSEKMLRKLNDLVGDFEPEVDSLLSIMVDADKEYQDVESPVHKSEVEEERKHDPDSIIN